MLCLLLKIAPWEVPGKSVYYSYISELYHQVPLSIVLTVQSCYTPLVF